MSSVTPARDAFLVERLRRALAAAGHDLAAEELSDLLWLALHTPPVREGPQAGRAVRKSVAVRGEEPRDRPMRSVPASDPVAGVVGPVPAAVETVPPDAGDRAMAGHPDAPPVRMRRPVYALTAAHAGTGAAPVRVPGIRGLSHQLGVARGLRPLKRTVPSAHAVELDETATAEAIADNDVLDLVLRPARERWLNLTVMVDDGLSMRVWKDTVTELSRLLSSLGIFRKVSVRDHSFAAPPRTAGLTTFGRTVVLVLSDATAPCWRDGTALRHLCVWARGSPTAVVQPLPARLWSGTGLDAEFMTVRTHRSAPANTALHTPHATLPVPVLELAEWDLGPWARLIASDGTSARLAVVDAAAPPVLPAASDPPHDRGPEERLCDFQSSVSSEAYELAGHLAAVDPLTLPVMRVVQSAVLPGSGPAHLSEVLLGGLMSVDRPLDGTGGRDAYDVFTFDPDVRALLTLTVRASTARRTVDAVSDFIGARIGRSDDFPALLADRTGTLRLPERRAPFGELPGGAAPDTDGGWQTSAAAGVVQVHAMEHDYIVTSLGFLVGPDRVLTAGGPETAQITGAGSAGPMNARPVWRQEIYRDDEFPELLLLRTSLRLPGERAAEPCRSRQDWPVLPGVLYLGLGPGRDRLTAYRCGEPRNESGSVLAVPLLATDPPAFRAVGAPVLAAGKLLGIVVEGARESGAVLFVRPLYSLSEASLNLLEGESEDSGPDPADVRPAHGLSNLEGPGVPRFLLENPFHSTAFTWLESSVRAAPRAAPFVLAGPRGTLKSETVRRYVQVVAPQHRLVWWVGCYTASRLPEGLAMLAHRLLPGPPGRPAWSVETAARWAVSWLRAHEGWLLVLDDVRARRDIDGYGLDALGTGTVVVTTRAETEEFAPLPTFTMQPWNSELVQVCAEIRAQNRHAYELLGVVAWYGTRVQLDLVRGLWPDVHTRVVEDAVDLLTARGVIQRREDDSFVTSPMLRMMMRTPAPPDWSGEHIAEARAEAVRVIFDRVPRTRLSSATAVQLSALARALDPFEDHVWALSEATQPSQDTMEMAILFFGVGLRLIWRAASPDGVGLAERACAAFDAAGEGRERRMLAENALSSVQTALAMSPQTLEMAEPEGVADVVSLIRRHQLREATRSSDRMLGPEHPLSASLRTMTSSGVSEGLPGLPPGGPVPVRQPPDGSPPVVDKR
ncbi:SAV_2336 N-terminal domain-related protein [Streptomyces apricus]|uniref:Uncharacterized protein n=1 Tax=Streptomyces apricus TaxID=1828112 RepID=A0A5B0BJP0_9ACTN|nr:SAV_2336 N-terminal domain-related protein [Streptomyces apricus]KAA0942404.1 hypothetical protein FGF04_03350 [Streptomyces apricus]